MAKTLLARSDLARRMVIPGKSTIRTRLLQQHAEAMLSPAIGKITNDRVPHPLYVMGLTQERLDQMRQSNPPLLNAPPEFKGKAGQVFVFEYVPAYRSVLIGLGPEKNFDSEGARKFGACAIREAEKLRVDSLTVSLDEINAGPACELARNVVFGAMLAAFRFEQKLAVSQEDAPVRIRIFNLMSEKPIDQKAMERAQLDANSQNTARYLSDMPSDQLNPITYVKLLQYLAHKFGIPYLRVRTEQLRAMNLNGIATVGKGSPYADSSSMVLMGDLGGENTPLRVIVGKGLTMDTGGNDIKPAGHMGDMQYDMEGSAAAMMSAVLLSRLGQGGLLSIACIAENMPGPHAFVSGNIIRIGQRTVRIMHTDAEGRLVLADGLSIAANLGPQSIYSIATLTGAAVRALGSGVAAAIFSETDELRQRLERAAELSGESVHHFPIHPSFAKLVEDPAGMADLANLASNGGEAGQTTAAMFLTNFARRYDGTEGGLAIPYAHIDMAPMMVADGALAKDPRYRNKLALGYGVQLLCAVLESQR